MAGTLTEGVQYGLSSNGLPSENKSLVFVKLTDSSFKAIEEYLRIKLKTQQQPNIQFLGNEGRLWFPTSSSADGGGAAFSFSLSSSAVVGGPQGSFECVQQCGSRSLESLGVMALKMNVKAKDDVYEATRQRMAVAEEESKKNCTRVIKLACGPDIGRVVKIRKHAAAVFPPRRERERPEDHTSSSSGHTPQAPVAPHRSTSSSSSSSLLSSSSSSSLYPSSTHHHSHHHVQNGRTSTSSPALGSSTASATNGRTSNAISPLPRSAASPSYNTTAATSSIGAAAASSNRVPSEYPQAGSEVNPDLMRRPLRERIIHLLAIRPYKKPELLSRLHKEGLKEKDKKLIMPVLNAVGLIKDQAYHLARHIWNDIQDDWPFYNESEKQILKRRKPQNLTPPVSDSSSGSGHSPPSSSSGPHHNGSPVGSSISSSSSKPNVSPSGGGGGGVKRLQHEALLDAAAAAAAAKKPRISHYKKPDSSQPSQQQQQQQHQSSHYSMQPDSRHAQQQQSHHHHQQAHNGNNKSSPSLKARPSPPGNQQPPPSSQQHHHYQQQHQQSQQAPSHNPYRSGVSSHQHHNHNHQSSNNNNSNANVVSSVPVVSTRVTSSTDGPDTPNSSPDSMAMDSDLPSSANGGIGGIGGPLTGSEAAEYTLQYQRIVSGEQRSRYKEDFNAQYNEYRDLHKAIDKVSKRFAQLEEELRQQHEGTVAYKRIKNQILREYQDNLRDTKYRETKRRFQHLHEKLAHIKRLVLEWDMAQTCRS